MNIFAPHLIRALVSIPRFHSAVETIKVLFRVILSILALFSSQFLQLGTDAPTIHASHLLRRVDHRLTDDVIVIVVVVVPRRRADA
jgi:hypothetical protein